MDAGRLRHRVTIQQSDESQGGAGGKVEAWSDLAEVWGAVEPLRGREFIDAHATQAAIDTRIRIRYRAGITPKMRVTWDTHMYDIQAVINLDTRNRELHLMCQEVL